jgi:hypothetical protein
VKKTIIRMKDGYEWRGSSKHLICLEIKDAS